MSSSPSTRRAVETSCPKERPSRLGELALPAGRTLNQRTHGTLADRQSRTVYDHPTPLETPLSQASSTLASVRRSGFSTPGCCKQPTSGMIESRCLRLRTGASRQGRCHAPENMASRAQRLIVAGRCRHGADPPATSLDGISGVRAGLTGYGCGRVTGGRKGRSRKLSDRNDRDLGQHSTGN